MRRVGVVMVTKETDPETPLRAMAFRQALSELGSSEGRNVVIDFRFSAGDLNAGFVAPCLPTKTDKLPSSREWLHEIKHDGFRVIARKKGAQVRLYSRLAIT
jgi:ATP-dependent DNA ligase